MAVLGEKEDDWTYVLVVGGGREHLAPHRLRLGHHSVHVRHHHRDALETLLHHKKRGEKEGLAGKEWRLGGWKVKGKSGRTGVGLRLSIRIKALRVYDG